MNENLKMAREKLIQIRGGHRAYVSKIIENVNGIVAQFSGSTTDRETLESFKATLKNKKEILKSIDEAILELTKEEDINKEIIEASDIGSSINRACVKKNIALSYVSSVQTRSSSNLSL